MLTDSEIKSIKTLFNNRLAAEEDIRKAKTFPDANKARIHIYQTNKDFEDYLESLRCIAK